MTIHINLNKQVNQDLKFIGEGFNMKLLLLLAIAGATGYVAYDAFYGEEWIDTALPPVEDTETLMD